MKSDMGIFRSGPSKGQKSTRQYDTFPMESLDFIGKSWQADIATVALPLPGSLMY